MSGELELVARGIEDNHMIGNPQISFFKVVYKRHTNFASGIRQSHLFLRIRPELTGNHDLDTVWD